MQLHQLKPIHKPKKRKRVGRGGKHGTYSGRGQKGQKSRAGRKFQPVIRELIKKYPKLKGYRSRVIQKDIIAVELDKVVKNFNESEIVSPKTLLNKGIIGRMKGKMPKVKILGKSELKKKLIFENCRASKSAKEAIIKAGGRIN
jgi:large subunit ribosomal protein L15